jgi:enoyl-CoA hydratase
MRSFYSLFLQPLRSLPVPTISAINGPAVGAGLCMTLATDLRVAAKGAKLGFTFVHLGLHPGMAGTFFLPRLVPQQVANRLLLTGEVSSFMMWHVAVCALNSRANVCNRQHGG